MTSNELEIFKQSILDDVRVMMQTTGQVTQYIGARYVPLFAEPLDWSAEREYEPLTIVLDHGNSFTSRQFVPKGVDISDESFWANTGNYNAQIEQYRQEVEVLKNKFQDSFSQFCNTYDTVAEMLSDTKLIEGAIAHTNGFYKQNDGGAAWYRVASDTVVNNLDVLKGANANCNLILIEGFISPEMLGAKGDGSTDDSAALQRAIDMCGADTYCQLSKKVYATSKTINVTNDYTNIIGCSNFKSTVCFTVAKGNDDALFNITAQNTVFDNISFRPVAVPSERSSTALDYNPANGMNADSNVKNCVFFRNYYAIKVRGRNVSLDSSLVSNCFYGYYIVDVSTPEQLRGYIITNNRFHGCLNVVYNTIKTATVNQNVFISNNFVDGGVSSVYLGPADGVVISGNTCRASNSANAIFIRFTSSAHQENIACVTNNMLCGYAEDMTTTSNIGVFITNTLKKAHITLIGNTIYGFDLPVSNQGSETVMLISGNLIKTKGASTSKALNIESKTNRGNIASNLYVGITGQSTESIATIPNANFGNTGNEMYFIP